MDDIVGFVAERIALQIRKSRELDAERRRIAEAIAAPQTPTAARPMPGLPGAPVAPSRTTTSSGPRPPASAAPRATAPAAPVATRGAAAARETRINLDDAFPTTLDPVAVARPAPTNALLAAFAGGTSLLGAVVLAEALAAPVSLREGPPHRPPG